MAEMKIELVGWSRVHYTHTLLRAPLLIHHIRNAVSGMMGRKYKLQVRKKGEVVSIGFCIEKLTLNGNYAAALTLNKREALMIASLFDEGDEL